MSVSRSSLRFGSSYHLSLICLISWSTLSCNRVDWVPLEDVIDPYSKPHFSIEGQLCASPSEDLSYPLRVLFVVDGSESMEVSDPPDPVTEERGRQRAVRETWTRLLEQSGGDQETKIGVMRFSAQAEFLTQEDLDDDGVADSFFTQSEDKLRAAMIKLEVTDRTTNYLNALDTIYLALRTEALGADVEALGRSKYVVIFISDGLPSDGANTGQGGLSDQIQLKIANIRKLEQLFGIGEVRFHTLFLSTEEGLLLDRPAQDLLEGMSRAGGGTYRSFPSGEGLNFLHIQLSRIKRLYSLKTLVPLPLHWVQSGDQHPKDYYDPWDTGRFLDADQDGALSCGEPMSDSDMDGLSDLFERRLGTNPLQADSDRDGLGDRVEWQLRRSGLSPLDPTDASCVPPTPFDPLLEGCLDDDQDGFCDCADEDQNGICDVPDTDGDGLNDCEEAFYGSSANRVDSDDDGLPDSVEFRYGTSPQQIEGRGDLDWDGTESATEILNGFDPLCDDAPIRSRVGFARELEEFGVVDQRSCYRFHVKGVPAIAPLKESPLHTEGASENRVLLFAGEGAYDETANVSLWRIACVSTPISAQTGRLPEPVALKPGERSSRERGPSFTLTDEDFVLADTFDPEKHCVRAPARASATEDSADPEDSADSADSAATEDSPDPSNSD